MAFLQRAWVFDPIAFHLELARTLMDHVFDVEVIRAEVVRRMRLPHASSEYLTMLGLESGDSLTDSSLGELYVASMAPHLRDVETISDPAWLHRYLVRLGHQTPADRLIFGDPLDMMIAMVPPDRLSGAVRGDLTTSFGGWLSASAAATLKAFLQSVQPVFLTPAEDFVHEYAATRVSTHSPVERVHEWYDEALRLLGALTDDDRCVLRLVAP